MNKYSKGIKFCLTLILVYITAFFGFRLGLSISDNQVSQQFQSDILEFRAVKQDIKEEKFGKAVSYIDTSLVVREDIMETFSFFANADEREKLKFIKALNSETRTD